MNEEINKRIDEIEQLLTNDTYDDYVKAISLMEKELQRIEEKKLLRYEVDSFINAFRPLYTSHNNTQVLEVINRATELVKNGNYEDYKQAKIILDKEHTWIADAGYRFNSTLSDYYEVLGKIEHNRRVEDEKREIAERNRSKKESEEAFGEALHAGCVFIILLPFIAIALLIIFFTFKCVASSL